jgi:hypothetical protein
VTDGGRENPALVQPDDEETRWSAAEALLDSSPDMPERPPLRRRWVPVGSVSALGFLLAVGVGVLLAVRGHGWVERQDGVALWREVTARGVGCAGLLVAVVGAVVAQRRGLWRQSGLVHSEAVLTRGQRKQLYAQISGRAPVAPGRLRLARHLAERLSRQGPFAVFCSGLAVSQAGRLIAADDQSTWVNAALAALLCFGLSTFVVVQARHAERFLRRHPAPASPGDVAA